jgi:hypothetical protein
MPDTRTASAGLILLKLAGSLLDEKLNQRLVWRAEDRLLIGDNFVVTQADLLPWVRRTFAQLQEASP